MKKILAILLAAMMLLSMVACNMGDNPDNPNKDNPGTSQSGENNDNQGGTENQGGEGNGDSNVEDEVTIKVKNTSTGFRDGVGTLTIFFVYSNKENIELVNTGEVSAAEWGFSTTDSNRTLTTVEWFERGVYIHYEGGTEADFSISNIAYTPIAGKEIKTVSGDVIEGFNIDVPYTDFDLY